MQEKWKHIANAMRKMIFAEVAKTSVARPVPRGEKFDLSFLFSYVAHHCHNAPFGVHSFDLRVRVFDTDGRGDCARPDVCYVRRHCRAF